MSFARIIASIACLISLFGCASYTRQTTETRPDGTKVTKTESGVEYRPTYSYGAVMASPVFYYTGYAVYYDQAIGYHYYFGGRRVRVAPYIVDRCVRRGNIVPRC